MYQNDMSKLPFHQISGGMSASLHMVSPTTKGLFQKVICQSGVCTYPGMVWSRERRDKFLKSKLKEKGM